MNRKLMKTSAFYLIGTIIVAIGGFVVSVLYSHFFDTSSYGDYCLILSIYSLISHFLAGWLSISIIRNYESHKKEKSEKDLIGSSFKFLIISSLVIIAITSLILLRLNLSKDLKIIILLFSFIFFFEFSIQLFNSIYRIEENVKQYNINTITNSFLKLFIVLLMYYLIGIHNIIIIPLSLLFTEILQFVYISIKLNIFRILKETKINLGILKKLFVYGFPLMGIGITSWVLTTSDRFVIAYFFDSSQVGIYSYSYSLANSIFTLLIQFIMLGAYPKIIKSFEIEGKESAENCLKDYMSIFMIVLMPLCVGACLVAKDFFSLFTSPSYQEGYIVFIITSISIFFLGLTQYYNKPYELKKNTNKILLINIIIAIFNLLLNLIFMKKFGYVFGAWSTLFSYILYIIIAIILNNTGMQVKYNYATIIKIVISVVYMCVSVYFINIFVTNILMRLIMEIIIGGLVYCISIFLHKTIKLEDRKSD